MEVHRDSVLPLRAATPEQEEEGRIRAKSGRNEKFACWIGVISGSYWEAVMLFAVYICIRWFPSLRSIAVILLASALVVIIKEVTSWFGQIYARWFTWSHLAKNNYQKLPMLQMQSGTPELLRFVLLGRFVLLVPLFIVGLPLCVLYWFMRQPVYNRETASTFWQIFGRSMYRYLLTEKVVSKEKQEEKREGATGRDDVGQPKKETETTTPVPSREENGTESKVSRAKLAGYLCGMAVCCPLIFPAAAILIVELALIGAFLVFFFLFAALLIVAGGHMTLFIVVGLEIVTSLVDVDLGQGQYEWFVWAAFAIPIYMLVIYLITKKLIPETLSALRNDLGPDHRLSKLSQIYFAIPVNEAQAAVKISDTAFSKGAKDANRDPVFFVLSVHSGSQNEFRCGFADKGEEHEYMGGMLTKEMTLPDLSGNGWQGTKIGTSLSHSAV